MEKGSFERSHVWIGCLWSEYSYEFDVRSIGPGVGGSKFLYGDFGVVLVLCVEVEKGYRTLWRVIFRVL